MFDMHVHINNNLMKVKCYSVYENGIPVLTEYANPSQSEFLTYELKEVMKASETS